MPTLNFNQNTSTGTYERRYTTGTLSCTLFTLGPPPERIDPARQWAGALSNGKGLAFAETRALQQAGLIDDLVIWSEKSLLRPLAFICKEGDLNAILRRIEEWDASGRTR
jgi:hypothetical protein